MANIFFYELALNFGAVTKNVIVNVIVIVNVNCKCNKNGKGNKYIY